MRRSYRTPEQRQRDARGSDREQDAGAILPFRRVGLGSAAHVDELEFDQFSDAVGFERDLPLSFRWRAEGNSIACLGLPAARNDHYEIARNAVLTEAMLADEIHRWVSFSRRKAFYVGRHRYHGAAFKYYTVLAAVADAVKASLLEEERALPGSRGRQSRFHATPLLSERLKEAARSHLAKGLRRQANRLCRDRAHARHARRG